MFWRSEIDIKNNLKISIHLKKKLLEILYESKEPPPHIHLVGHYRKMYIVCLMRSREGVEEAVLKNCLS